MANENNTPSGKIETPHDWQNDILQIEPADDAPFANMIPFDPEIEAVRQQYCANSGKPLSKVPADVVNNIITIHGRETCIKILKTQQIKYSYEWIWLNHEGLEKLALHQPREYFIYATCKLMQDVTVDDELERLHMAADAWQLLQSVDETVIAPVNETLRRLLAGYKRKQINKYLAEFKWIRIDLIAESLSNISAFQIELTDLLQFLIEERKKKEAIEEGMSVFRMQRMITALSQLEIEVGKELNDFDIIDGKSSDVIHAITGTQYQHIKSDGRQKNYSTKPIIQKPAKTGFKIQLKIGK